MKYFLYYSITTFCIIFLDNIILIKKNKFIETPNYNVRGTPPQWQLEIRVVEEIQDYQNYHVHHRHVTMIK